VVLIEHGFDVRWNGGETRHRATSGVDEEAAAIVAAARLMAAWTR
jgi:hypothetical protein